MQTPMYLFGIFTSLISWRVETSRKINTNMLSTNRAR